jgi:glycosyltransferase involved in cell wall biosynthesis
MSQERKVLIVGDSPLLKTGFGRVNAIAAKRFQEEGWQVASVAGLTTEPPKDDEGIRLYVPSERSDVLGIRDIPNAVEDFKPDVVYATADPGSVVALAYGLPDMPAFIYTPIEGEPIINRDWRLVLKTLSLATCSKYGSDLIKTTLNRDVPYVYHGVDHETFKVTGIRDDIRRAMKWGDKFVISCVATNVRRKQLPRLLEAVARLKHQYNQKDIILYMHTVPFQNYWLEGWNLFEVVNMFGIQEETFFHPLMVKRNAFIPERTGDPKNPGLADIIEASDLFVNPSMVEGFGLPPVEAMACGVPVLVTKYAAGWEVVSPAGRGIPVGDWEVHKSGTMYANVSVEQLAKEILRLKRNPKERARMSAAGLIRAKDFDWEIYKERLIPFVEQAIESHQTSRAEKEGEDSGNATEGSSQDGSGEVGGEEEISSLFDIPEGQGEVVTSEGTSNDAGKTQRKQEAT